jgi:hypothetical protein
VPDRVVVTVERVVGRDVPVLVRRPLVQDLFPARVFADAGGAETASASTPRTTATLAAMRRAGRMVPSLPVGGRVHWQRSLINGLDARVSRLLSLCKSIPWPYRSNSLLSGGCPILRRWWPSRAVSAFSARPAR